MTPHETVVIETLEHTAQLWDATSPEQASAFRDAAAILREHGEQQVPPETAPTFPPTQVPEPEPVRDETLVAMPDPNDGTTTNG